MENELTAKNGNRSPIQWPEIYIKHWTRLKKQFGVYQYYESLQWLPLSEHLNKWQNAWVSRAGSFWETWQQNFPIFPSLITSHRIPDKINQFFDTRKKIGHKLGIQKNTVIVFIYFIIVERLNSYTRFEVGFNLRGFTGTGKFLHLLWGARSNEEVLNTRLCAIAEKRSIK